MNAKGVVLLRFMARMLIATTYDAGMTIRHVGRRQDKIAICQLAGGPCHVAKSSNVIYRHVSHTCMCPTPSIYNMI